jgi:hypothetical protein
LGLFWTPFFSPVNNSKLGVFVFRKLVFPKEAPGMGNGPILLRNFDRPPALKRRKAAIGAPVFGRSFRAARMRKTLINIRGLLYTVWKSKLFEWPLLLGSGNSKA